MSDLLHLHEVDNSVAPALEERGVRWPMAGFSPGRATLLCTRCFKRHQAAEGSSRCLPCAVATAVDVGLRACDSQTTAFHRGQQAALDAVARFVAAGAKNWSTVLVPSATPKSASPPGSRVTGPSDRRPITDATRESIREQAREAERLAAAKDEPDPDGGDAA